MEWPSLEEGDLQMVAKNVNAKENKSEALTVSKMSKHSCKKVLMQITEKKHQLMH